LGKFDELGGRNHEVNILANSTLICNTWMKVLQLYAIVWDNVA